MDPYGVKPFTMADPDTVMLHCGEEDTATVRKFAAIKPGVVSNHLNGHTT